MKDSKKKKNSKMKYAKKDYEKESKLNNKKRKNRKPIATVENGKELQKTKKKGFWKKHRKLTIFLRILLALIVLAIIAVTGVVVAIMSRDDWKVDKESLVLNNMNTTIYDSEGVEIASVAGDEKRRPVALDKIPQTVKDAFVSIEDETFYEHHGVNLKRTIGATITYVLKHGSAAYGGSTITQQLIKNIYDDDSNSGTAGIERKIREISRAYQVEKILSKDQILELYLNIIFMGGDVYGVELGSQYYFSKSVSELDLAESAFLAGINHSPNSYNPYGETDNKEKITKRTKIVLDKMKELGKISQEEYNTAMEKVNAGFEFKKGNASTVEAMSYLAKSALDQIINIYAKENDMERDVASAFVCSSGYKIYTTQVTAIQNSMEEIYHNEKYIVYRSGVGAQSATVIIDHKTGYVVGCMGGLGSSVNSNGYNRAVTATRQPGSAIKPIASIAPSLENGIITAATVYDESNTYFGKYNPTNSGRGLITVRKAIEISANTTEVKIMSELGPSTAVDYLKTLGISSLVTSDQNAEQNDENLAMVLGGLTNGISPLEMAGAYAAIANNGVYITPTFYTKVEDSVGNIVYEPKQEKRRVLSEGNAYILQSILTGPVLTGTASGYGVKVPNIMTCGKTGTTNDTRDKWFCGFTPYYTAATWYGYDDNSQLNTGTNYAAKLWAPIMKAVHEGLDGAEFEQPSSIVSARICKSSGKVATSACSDTYTEYFVKGTVPDECDGHKTLRICKETGKIANENCPSTEVKTYTAKPEKEDTNLWKTSNQDKYNVPTEVCTTHTKKVVTMISVLNLTQADATAKLKALGLTVKVTTKTSDKAEGIVLEQSKKAGEELTAGDTVTITVSKKAETTTNTTNTTTDTTNTTVDKTNTAT